MTDRRTSRPSPRLLTMGIAATLALGLLGEGAVTHVASAATTPSTPTTTTDTTRAAPKPPAQRGLRIAPTSDTVTAYAYDGYVYLDSPVWLAAYGENYEFWAKRSRASDPVTLTKTVTRGKKRTSAQAPAAIVDGLNGFKNGLTVRVTTPQGKVVAEETRTLCPSGYDRQRVEPTGRTEPVYPTFCGGSWFTKSSVFGVEQGWATRLDAYFELETTSKNLVMTTSISKPVAKFLGLPATRRSVTQQVQVVDECEMWGAARSRSRSWANRPRASARSRRTTR
jgi:hypothetical protein